MQRLLAGDAELGQKPPHRDKAQGDLEFVLDQFGDHLAGPQRESELHLQRVLLRHGVKMHLVCLPPSRNSHMEVSIDGGDATMVSAERKARVRRGCGKELQPSR